MSRFARLFIPSKENQYAPHILQRVALMVMAILVCFTFAVSNIYSVLWQYSDWMVAAVLPGVIVELTNDERADESATPLVRSNTLDFAAQLKAKHMANNSYFAHYAPDGTTPWHWFREAGYEYVHAGENLAIHFNDSGAVIDAWMNSPTHRDNIVDQKFTEIGVGTARGMYEGYETVFVVQLFGTPSVASVPMVAEVPPESAPEATVLAEQTATEPESASEPAVEPTPELESNPDAQEEKTVTSESPAADESSVEPVAVATPAPDTISEPETVEPKTNPEASEVVVEDVAVSDAGAVSVYSGTVTTTVANAIPATVNPEASGSVRNSSFIEQVLTQPNTLLGMVYLLLASFVVVALMISILIEIRHQHPVQIAYGLVLLVMMGGLYAIHMNLTQSAVIV